MKITAVDRDLTGFNLTFTVDGTNLFAVESTHEEIENKVHYTAKLITTQQIIRLENDIEFTLTATVNIDC